MNLEIRKSVVIHYILIYILIIFQGSVFFKNFQDYFYIGTFLAFGLFFCGWRARQIDERYYLGIIVLAVLLILSYVATSGSLGIPSILNILCRYLLVLLVYYYDRNKFSKRLFTAITWLAAISLLFYAAQMVDRNIIKLILPSYENSNHIYYGSFIYCMPMGDDNRNCGIFAEPGLYSIVLAVAIYMILFMDSLIEISEGKKRIALVILIGAMITCQSTTGYISMVILFGFYLVSRTKNTKYKKWIIVLVMLFLVFDLNRGYEGVIYQNFLSKLFDSSGQFDVTVSTGAARYYSMIADISVANNYFFGAGFEIYNRVWKSYLPVNIGDVASCVGITYSMATTGYIATIYSLLFYVWMLFRNQPNRIARLAFIALFVNISLGQPNIRFVILMSLMLVECDKNRLENALEGVNSENLMVN